MLPIAVRRGLAAALLAACALPASAEPPSSPLSSGEALTAGDALSRFLPAENADRDGRRTLGQFPKNLGRSFVGVFAKDNLAPFLVGSAFASSAALVDGRTRSALRGDAPGISGAASRAGGLTYMVPATLGLFAAGRFTGDGRFRAFSYDATQAVVVNAVYTDAFKRLASRTRPDGSNNLSFPSGHTSNAFALATVANAHYGWKAGAPAYLAAGAIGLSRITNDKHHLSDVLAGATLGYITGRTTVRVNGEPTGRRRVFSLHPVSDAQGAGVGLGATLSW